MQSQRSSPQKICPPAIVWAMFLACVPPFQLGPLISGLPQPPAILQSLLQSFCPFSVPCQIFQSSPTLRHLSHTHLHFPLCVCLASRRPENSQCMELFHFKEEMEAIEGIPSPCSSPLPCLVWFSPAFPPFLVNFFPSCPQSGLLLVLSDSFSTSQGPFSILYPPLWSVLSIFLPTALSSQYRIILRTLPL